MKNIYINLILRFSKLKMEKVISKSMEELEKLASE